MSPIQKKLLDYHHGWFMAVGLLVFFAGFLDFFFTGFVAPGLTLVMMVLGAMILGYGTGRCDETCSIN